MRKKRISPIPLFIMILASIMGTAVAIEELHFFKIESWLNPNKPTSKVDPIPKVINKEEKPIPTTATVQHAGETPPPVFIRK